MSVRDQLVLEIFREALDTSPGERDSFISQRCGDDTELLQRVTALLQRVEQQEDPESPPAAEAPSPDPLLGTFLGPFRIIEGVGRGGMGVVYRGRREGSDFTQDVALKLIRRGFDFDDIRARFLRERRILARLDHPKLTRLIDGGVTADGRPWFALEFVRGQSITHWCDERNLGVRARVRLFIDVCAAVQYAHAQLVVHRDLKPGNILVDGDGQVRLLDFGIARLLGNEEAGATLTVAGTRGVLTPEYAAPEQFVGDTAGVATDVYALGVVLFELASGALPYEFDRGDLAAAERAVRERPPQTPVQALARDGAATALNRLRLRATSQSAYRKDVRGDLGRILEKALAKEPARRYASVQAFADDLSHWLDGAPVHAVGDAFGYRLRKFIGRNRIAVVFALLALAAVIGGLATTIWQMREAQVQRDDALAAARRSDATRGYLMLMFRNAAGSKDATKVNVREVFRSGAEKLFDEFRNDPESGQTTALMLSDLYLQLGDAEGARPLLERLLKWPGIDANPDVQANARYNLAQVELVRGAGDRARELLDQAQAWWVGRPGNARLLLNESRSAQAKIERAEGKVDQAIETLRASIAERRVLVGEDDFDVGNQLNTLANAQNEAGFYEEAEKTANEAIGIFKRLGEGHSDGGLAALNTRANAALMTGRNEQALHDYQHVAEMTRALYGATTKLAALQNNVGVSLTRLGRHEEALPALEESIRLAREQNGERSPLAVTARISLSELLSSLGRMQDAEPLAQEALEIALKDYPKNVKLLGSAYRARATLRLAQNRDAEARADLEQATTLLQTTGRAGAAYIRLMDPLRARLEKK